MERSLTWSAAWTQTQIEALKNRRPLFVFDLDSTITKCELLPLIAQQSGVGENMAMLTEAAMGGCGSFEANFAGRVELLKDIPVSQARAIAAGAPLNGEIARFLRENAQRCLILTGNLDVWIEGLVERLGMKGRCVCSAAEAREDRLTGILSILNKEHACAQLLRPFVAVGDGSNDIGMLKAADVGIAFSGVRSLSENVVSAADAVTDDEHELTAFLARLL